MAVMIIKIVVCITRVQVPSIFVARMCQSLKVAAPAIVVSIATVLAAISGAPVFTQLMIFAVIENPSQMRNFAGIFTASIAVIYTMKRIQRLPAANVPLTIHVQIAIMAAVVSGATALIIIL